MDFINWGATLFALILGLFCGAMGFRRGVLATVRNQGFHYIQTENEIFVTYQLDPNSFQEVENECTDSN